uniref:Uncharacterized protein n=1 Tax=Rhizophora mucronata TaxID=61149 RepID=A0A2P2R5E9_RHIMU
MITKIINKEPCPSNQLKGIPIHRHNEYRL